MLPARQRLAGLVVLLAAGWPPIHGYGLTVRRSNVFARQSPASSSLKPPTSRSSRRSWLGVVAAALVAAPGCGLAAAEDAAAATTTTAATEAPPTVQDLNARGYAQWTPTSPKNTPAAWKEQVAAGYTELLRLDRDWLVITKPRIEGDVPDGDAVRRVVGTVGTSSPLYGIRAVFRNIREYYQENDDTSVDFVDFAEKAGEIESKLTDVDFLAYSTIFADPSGGAGSSKMSSAAYLEKTNAALKAMLPLYLDLLESLGIKAGTAGRL